MSIERKKEDKDTKQSTKPKKKSIWEEVIADVSKASSVPDSHLLLLGTHSLA